MQRDWFVLVVTLSLALLVTVAALALSHLIPPLLVYGLLVALAGYGLRLVAADGATYLALGVLCLGTLEITLVAPMTGLLWQGFCVGVVVAAVTLRRLAQGNRGHE